MRDVRSIILLLFPHLYILTSCLVARICRQTLARSLCVNSKALFSVSQQGFIYICTCCVSYSPCLSITFTLLNYALQNKRETTHILDKHWEIRFDEVVKSDVLGKGSSGVVYRGCWKG